MKRGKKLTLALYYKMNSSTHTQTQLLVDADNFWQAIEKDILAAKNSVFIQTLSFEGDSVGKKLANLLLSLPSTIKIKILIDRFTMLRINDKWLFHAVHDAKLWHEIKETKQLIKSLKAGGIAVKFCYTGKLSRPMMSNHKKLIIVDDVVAYTGGFNFCEHNFLWHDLTIRFSNKTVIDIFKQDFLATWHKNYQIATKHFKGGTIHFLSGYNNKQGFNKIFKLIQSATNKIIIQSPYLTVPTLNEVIDARKRGVHITIITPKKNNLRVCKPYILWHAAKHQFKVHILKGMTHLKAMLIDDKYLIVGTSNFDFLSYHFYQEIIIVITDVAVINEFKTQVLEKDLKQAELYTHKVNNLKGFLSNAYIKTLNWLSSKV